VIIETSIAEPAAPQLPTPTIIDMIYNPVLEDETEVFSEACRGCKLLDRFKEGMNSCHAIRPRYDLRALPEAKGTILIIVPAPGATEDKMGHPLTTYSGGGFLNSFISNLDNHWVVANSQGCYAGKDSKGKKVKLGKAQIENCQNEYVRELIKQLRPKVVVFLGMEPMQCVLGPHAPKTLGKALGDPIKFPENEYFIIGAEDPIVHQSQRKDLEKTYLSLFQQADRLCNGDYHTETVEYELVTTSSRLKELSRSLSERICLDTEDDHNLRGTANLAKKSIWHPGVNMILLQITERVDTFYEPFKLKNYVFVPELLTKANIISLIKNRIIICWNQKYDFTSLIALKGLNPFRYIKGWEDSFLSCVSMDQGKSGNSLKDRARLHFNLTPYETELWRDIEATDRAIRDSWSLIDGLIKEDIKKIKEAGTIPEKKQKGDAKYEAQMIKWNEYEAKVKEREESGKKPLKPKPEPVRKEYELVDIEAVEANLERLKAAQLKLRPIGDANFGDVTKDVLNYYGACDTMYNYKMQDEVIDQYIEAGDISPIALEMNKRNVFSFSMVESAGLPMSMPRHRILSKVLEGKVTALKKYIISDPHVQEALSRTPEVAELAAKGKLTYEYLFDEAIKPNKRKFLAQLLLVTGVINEYSPQTSGSNKDGRPIEYKLNNAVLTSISGGEDDTPEVLRQKGWTPFDKKNAVQRVWYAIFSYRKLLDLTRKFLVSLANFQVDGRLRSSFHLGRTEIFGQGTKGTITGRIATSSPSLGNLSKNLALRWCFKAKLNSRLCGYEGDATQIENRPAVYIEADHVSQEPVVLAHITQCKAWLYIFKHRLGIYEAIANILYKGGIDIYGDPDTVRVQLKAKYPKEGPGSEVRSIVKTGALALAYGEHERTFSNRTGIPLEEVKHFYKQFNEAFPEIAKYKKYVEGIVNRGEMMETAFGLRRSTRYQRTGDPKRDHQLHSSMQRMTFNCFVQNFGCNLLYCASYAFNKWVFDNNLEHKVNCVNTVHDSLWVICDYDFLEEVEAKLHEVMSDMSLLPKGVEFPPDLLFHSFKVGEDLAALEDVKTNTADWKKEREKSLV